MEAQAVLAAVETAGIRVCDLDLILVGPTIQDQPMPGNAALVQHKVGASCAAINVETACTSLLSQMVVAQGLILSGAYTTIACVASANWTKAADYSEKNCMLLGDGASAVILQPVGEGRGILGSHLETDGSYWGSIGCAMRLPRNVLSDYANGDYLQGPREKILFYVDRGEAGVGEIKNAGPIKTPAAAEKALAKAGLTPDDVDFLICHNPTEDLVAAWRQRLGISLEKNYTTLSCYGNMSGASLGANLHEAVQRGKIKDGNLVLMCAPGAGYHYAAIALRWGR
ncbi:MAG: 3-oxoacyl-ACP synthase III family protein [Thermodesulfobacteriota bacterium]